MGRERRGNDRVGGAMREKGRHWSEVIVSGTPKLGLSGCWEGHRRSLGAVVVSLEPGGAGCRRKRRRRAGQSGVELS
jgi:hypothetical protein